MSTENLAATREELLAEKTRLARRLNFCGDPAERAKLERRLREIASKLEQFDGLVRLSKPRAIELRDRNLRRLGITPAGVR